MAISNPTFHKHEVSFFFTSRFFLFTYVSLLMKTAKPSRCLTRNFRKYRLEIKSRKGTKFVSNSYQMQTSVSSCNWKQTVVDCDWWVSVFIVWVRTVSSAVRLNSAWSVTRLSCDWWISICFAFMKRLKMPRYRSPPKAAEWM